MPFVNFQDVNFERYDVFVAGSGPAGAVVAKHLAAAGKQVLVVETGGRDFDANVQDAYAAVYSQGHYIADYWSRHWIRSLGGTSSVWAGWVTPLLERNLKNWPLSRKDL
ncbi:MAG: FAD-dependent monooxygenase, partial [Pseudomonadota bacterium]